MIGVNEHHVPTMVEMRQHHRPDMVICRTPPYAASFLRREEQPTLVLRRHTDGVRVHLPDPPTRS